VGRGKKSNPAALDFDKASGIEEGETNRGRGNRWKHIAYGERSRSGERISSAFVEATVNAVISKRFVKKQQMQWSRTGAHLLLQTRTQTLGGCLHSTFRQWYLGHREEQS
jgi:hypothetical protein